MTLHQAHWLLDLHKTSIGKNFKGKIIRHLFIAPVRHEKILLLAYLLFYSFCTMDALIGFEEFDLFVVFDHEEGIANGTFKPNSYSTFTKFFGIT